MIIPDGLGYLCYPDGLDRPAMCCADDPSPTLTCSPGYVPRPLGRERAGLSASDRFQTSVMSDAQSMSQ